MKTITSLKSMEGNIQGFILSIVGVGVVLAVGLIVLVQLQANTGASIQCTNATFVVNGTTNCYLASNTSVTGTQYLSTTTAYNATGDIVTQLGTVPQWIGIIITVALAFIVLGYFYNRM